MGVQYLPLDRSCHEIRLLAIFPASDERERFIPRCRTFHASLTDRPRYTALSYVWGSAEQERLMIVDDAPVRVTKNLFDAVMTLRLPRKSLTIWIDFLCINQNDEQEKSWQVELMRDIYGLASQVYAWLGPADDESDQVMKYLDALGHRAELCGIEHAAGHQLTVWQDMLSGKGLDVNQASRHFVSMTDGSYIVVLHQDLESLFRSISGWHDQSDLFPVDGMQRFFKRSWWGRIWVFQEITLPEHAEFICGSQRISRSRYSAALTVYVTLWTIIAGQVLKDISCLTSYHFAITTSLFHHRPNVMLSSRRVFKHESFPLAALLRLTCVGSINLQLHGPHHLESTDPRDKVFALLSLACDREELKEQGISPDYTKSCADIYTSTMAVLLAQGHISLLSFCQNSHLQPDLPSWVPDWSRPAMSMLQGVDNDHVTMYPVFAAAGPRCCNSKLAAIKLLEDGKVLMVSGKLYDVVEIIASFGARVSTRQVPLSENLLWPRRWLVEILRLTYRKRCFKDFWQRLGAAVRTSIADIGFDENARLARVGDQRVSDAINLLRSSLGSVPAGQLKLDIQKFLGSTPDQIIPKIVRGQHLCSEINGKSLGRVPFITKKGHLGLSTEMTQPGDIVALIEGSQVPFIVRHYKDGTYQLVHEAYIDGIMDGEVARTSRLRRISLR